ncbi:MAG: DNA polymerase III subunit alpha, partial [Candidatus Izemoplasmatales bacterium]
MANDIYDTKRVDTRVTKAQLAGTERLSVKLGDENLIGAGDFLKNLNEVDRLQYDEMFNFMLFQIERGWFRKLEGRVPEDKLDAYLKRLKFETFEIYRLGFIKYVLIVWDICQYARKNSIPFNARGSANASLALYCLDIISLDPMVSGPGGEPLIFTRFISPDRIDYPDIDLDFADIRRPEIKEYLNEKYGSECVAEIGTFITMKGKQCLRDVARVRKISRRETDQVSALIVQRSGGDARADFTIMDAFTAFPACIQYREKYPEVIDDAVKLEGQIRGQGVHASGVVVSNRPLRFDIPLGVKKDGTKVAGFEMKDTDTMGLLKLDILGLRTLRVISDTVALVAKRHDFDICQCDGCKEIRRIADEKRLRIDRMLSKMKKTHPLYHYWEEELKRVKPRLDVWFEDINYGDPKVYKLFQEGYTLGIFQFESKGFQKLSRRAKPVSIIDLADLNALHRPGPIRSGIMHEWLLRRSGKSENVPVHPFYDKATLGTQGLMLYQEQIMGIVHDVGGFVWSKTDIMRKAISKSVGEEFMRRFKVDFVDGAKERGMGEDEAGKVFDQIISFGSYSFNMAHASAYAYLAYRCAFLKTYFTKEFLLCEINSQSSDKEKIHNLIQEARRVGVPVNLPDVNKSNVSYSLGSSSMRAGFSSIKGVGPKAAQNLVDNQPYKDWFDFMGRINRRQVNRGSVSALISAGAFKEMYPNTRVLLENLPVILDGKQDIVETVLEIASHTDLESFPPYTTREETELQMSVLTLPTEINPLDFYKDVYDSIDDSLQITPISELDSDSQAGSVLLKAVMTSVSYGYRQAGKKDGEDEDVDEEYKGGAYVNLDDGTDFIMGVFNPAAYERYKVFLENAEGSAVLVKARKGKNADKIEIDDLTVLPEFQENLKIGKLSKFEQFLINPPLKQYKHIQESLKLSDICDVNEALPTAKKSQQFRLWGVVSNVREHTTKKGGRMAFVAIDDMRDSIELLVWPDGYAKFKKYIKIGEAVAVKAHKLDPMPGGNGFKLQLNDDKEDKVYSL